MLYVLSFFFAACLAVVVSLVFGLGETVTATAVVLAILSFVPIAYSTVSLKPDED